MHRIYTGISTVLMRGRLSPGGSLKLTQKLRSDNLTKEWLHPVEPEGTKSPAILGPDRCQLETCIWELTMNEWLR